MCTLKISPKVAAFASPKVSSSQESCLLKPCLFWQTGTGSLLDLKHASKSLQNVHINSLQSATIPMRSMLMDGECNSYTHADTLKTYTQSFQSLTLACFLTICSFIIIASLWIVDSSGLTQGQQSTSHQHVEQTSFDQEVAVYLSGSHMAKPHVTVRDPKIYNMSDQL